MIFHRLLMAANGKPPFKPFILFPVDEEVLFEFDFIEATSFEDSGGVGAHRHTQWQLANDEEFADIVYDTGQSINNLTEIEVGDLETEMLTEYFVRVKYFSILEPSRWSEPVKFSTNLYEQPVLDWGDDIFDALMFGF